MTTEDAKKILSFYRPGTADGHDPAFAEALEMARRAGEKSHEDGELAKWFQDHCVNYTAGKLKFRDIPVPAGFREQILAERKIVVLPKPEKKWSVPILMGLAAALVALACVATFALRRGDAVSDFVACRTQMVRMALSPYSMDLESTNKDQVRSYLAEHGAPANYALPTRLTAAQLAGCGVKSWDDAPVSMICFRSGRPLRAGDSTDLWLFVIDSNLLKHPPKETPVFAQVSRGTTASWSRGNRTYILVGAGDEAFLEEYL